MRDGSTFVPPPPLSLSFGVCALSQNIVKKEHFVYLHIVEMALTFGECVSSALHIHQISEPCE